MNNLARFLTASVFAFAGAAAHANAAVEQSHCGSSTCFQLTPVAKGADSLIAEDGASRTTQGQRVAENGARHTPQGQWLESQTV